MTIRQPKASAVVFELQRAIWRPVPPEVGGQPYTGLLVIHASGSGLLPLPKREQVNPYSDVMGCLLGVVDLAMVEPVKRKGVKGMLAWRFGPGSARVFREPLAWPGAMGVFDLPAYDVIEQAVAEAITPQEAMRTMDRKVMPHCKVDAWTDWQSRIQNQEQH